jgi:hypothetical protein
MKLIRSKTNYLFLTYRLKHLLCQMTNCYNLSKYTSQDVHMSDFLWWRDGVIYQIYPRSFAYTNGDGLVIFKVSSAAGLPCRPGR